MTELGMSKQGSNGRGSVTGTTGHLIVVVAPVFAGPVIGAVENLS
ncbi:hypothetical protein L830_1722 [Mycobacteroides abscessus MAB_082312_2258]|nr:hypothetical protein L830_1722 [Mycobacteroides abscessus MAB_082312_2258]